MTPKMALKVISKHVTFKKLFGEFTGRYSIPPPLHGSLQFTVPVIIFVQIKHCLQVIFSVYNATNKNTHYTLDVVETVQSLPAFLSLL